MIVEGIETAAQLEILRDLHCDEVQGYLLGRPAQLMHQAERPKEMTTQLLIAGVSLLAPLLAPLSTRDAEVAEAEALQPLAV